MRAYLGVLRGLLVLAAGCATAPAAQSSSSSADAGAAEGSGGAAAPASTLYDRLGGQHGIETVIDDFLARIAADERVNARFAQSDVPRVRRRLVELICQLTGGPCTYSGRSMKDVHAGMGITGAQFNAIAGHLVAALQAAHVRPEDQKTLLGVVGGTRGDIVEEP